MKKKQIEEMAKVLCGLRKGCDECKFNGNCLAYNSADLIYNAGYRKQSEWISVDEALPENIVNCIVHFTHSYSCEDGYYAMGMSLYNGDKFVIGKEYKVTHWMPLPEAPQMKGGEG